MSRWVKIQKIQKGSIVSFPSSLIPLSGEPSMVTLLYKLPGCLMRIQATWVILTKINFQKTF